MTAIFGKANIGATAVEWAGGNDLVGCLFTCPENCTVISIHAYFYTETAAVKAKVAIYKNSDLSLVAGSTEEDAPTSAAWVRFTFSSTVTLVGGTAYLLCIWSNCAGHQSWWSYSDAGDTNQTSRDIEIYNGFPDPFSKDNSYNTETSICCLYTPTTTTSAAVIDNDNPNITYGHGSLEDCEKASDWTEHYANMLPADASMTNSYGGVFSIAATFDDANTEVACYEKDVTNASTTTYPNAMVRFKTSESSAGAQAQIQLIFTDGTAQTVVLGYTTLMKAVIFTVTSGKTLDKIRLYAVDDGTNGTFYVYYDFVLLHKDFFTIPNVAYGLEFRPPPKYAVIPIPGKVGDTTEPLGSESATVTASCDLDIGDWKRSGDYINGEVFVDIAHNSSSEPWQWLDTGSEQFKVTLEEPAIRKTTSNNTSKHILDLLFREYRQGDASNETYVERFGLNL